MEKIYGLVTAAGVASLVAAAVAASPGTRPAPLARSAPAPASSLPVNIDARLQELLTLDADGVPLVEVVDQLRKTTRTNITVNWNALAAAGVTRDLPVTIHVKDATYEAGVRALMELLPAEKGGGANYTVGDNILDITTNAELGKGPEPHVRTIDRPIGYSFNPKATPDERTANGKVLERIVMVELRRAGEPMDARGHSLQVKDDYLVANISDRGLAVVDKVIANFNGPVKVGQIAGGTQLTAQAKRAAEAMKALKITDVSYAALARNQDDVKGKLSVAVMCGTAPFLEKDSPGIDGVITDGGVLLLGPKPAVRARTMFAVYDLRDVMKRLTAKAKPAPAPADIQASIVTAFQQAMKPDGDGTWGDLESVEKSPHATAMIPYNGLLAVFATPATHRAVSAALQNMNK